MCDVNLSTGGTSDGKVEFPPTLWTLVLQAAHAEPEKAQNALGELCERYRLAIRAYFALKCRNPQTAEDLTGSFILRFLEKNRLRHFERRENLRFRNYLSRALKNFLRDHLPEPPSESLESHITEASEEPHLDSELDAELAVAIHHRALNLLAQQATKPETARRLEVLRPLILREGEGDEYQNGAKALGLSPNALRQAVFRLRNQYYETFRSEVAQTVGYQRGELEAEMRYLMSLLPKALESRSSHN